MLLPPDFINTVERLIQTLGRELHDKMLLVHSFTTMQPYSYTRCPHAYYYYYSNI